MEIDTIYIIDYLEKRLSEKEQKGFEEQIACSPELRKEVEQVRFILKTTDDLKFQKQIDARQNWKKLARQISFDKYRRRLGNWVRTAAAVLLIPALIASFTLFKTLKDWNNLPVEQVELTSAYGLVSKVTLSDGTEIWLNSGSRITYPKRFTQGERVVTLSGEAYFKVRANKSRRFDVLTSNGLKVSAYGTEFNVNAYEEDTHIETTLAKGNVEVSLIGQPSTRTLRPGQQVIFNKENNNMEVEKVNLMVETSWKDGKMVFRRAGMNEIIRRLSRRYNVDIRLEGKELYDYKYSATFTHETLDEILQLLEKTAPIKCRIIEPRQSKDYTYSKRTVIIRTIQ